MSSAPAVASFEPALAVLDSAFFFRHSPSGIGKRLIAITVLHVYIILISLLLLSLTQLDDRRKGKRHTLWAWRIIRRPSGVYFAGNQIFLIPTCAIVGSVFQIVNTIYTYQAILYNGPVRTWMLWRAMPALALFVTSWQMSWASAQASTLAFESTGGTDSLWWWSPKIWMALFLGLGVAGTVATLALILVSTFNWYKVDDLANAIYALAATGDPSQSAAQLQALVGSFRGAMKAHQLDLRALFIVVCIGQSITSLFMLSSILLARHLRRQVTQSISFLRKDNFGPQSQPPSSGSAEFSISSPPSPSPTSTTFTEKSPASPTALSYNLSPPTSPLPSPAPPILPTRSDLRSTIKSVAVEDAWRKQTASRILALDKAGQDLLLVGTFVMALSTAFVGASLWLLFDSLPTNPVNWVWMETSITIHSWLYGSTFSVLLSSLAWNAWVHLAPRVKAVEEKGGKERLSLVLV